MCAIGFTSGGADRSLTKRQIRINRFRPFEHAYRADRNFPRQRNSVDAGVDIEKNTEWWSLEQQPGAYYRAAAARARMLQAEATTPRLKKYLGEVIARCERLAGEVESTSGND
jgi:hypothetical protein